MTTSALIGTASGLAGLILGLALALGPSDSVPDQPSVAPLTQEPEIGWRQRQNQEQEKLRASLQGSWTLAEFNHSRNNLDGVPVTGYMGITEDLLTILVHAGDPEVGLFDDPRRFQAGVHHWRLSEEGRLQLASVLAHSNFADGALVFENLYTTRQYEITLSESRLDLTRPDRSVLRFAKLEEQIFPETVLRNAGLTSRDPKEGQGEQEEQR